MIYSIDRRISSATSNYREYIDPESRITHVSVDFYLQMNTTNVKEWILYHNGIKELYRLKLDMVAEGMPHGWTHNWVRLTAIWKKDEAAKNFVRNLEENNARAAEEQRAAEERQRVEAELRRQEEATQAMRRFMEEQETSRSRNDAIAEGLGRGIVQTEPLKPSIEEVSPKRDFSNLIVDE